MPDHRPEIPAEVKRRVLVDAGHCCSVCGVPNPLDFAHIVPWAKTKSHEYENLIAICSNCHRRSHNEKWGAKTLREYKRNPWINRPRSRGAFLQRQNVRIEIEVDLEDMNPHQRDMLHYALAGFLGIDPDAIKIDPLE